MAKEQSNGKNKEEFYLNQLEQSVELLNTLKEKYEKTREELKRVKEEKNAVIKDLEKLIVVKENKIEFLETSLISLSDSNIFNFKKRLRKIINEQIR